MTYVAGANSESYFPVGFNPFVEFGTFFSGGLIHSTNTRILVPLAFSGRVSNLGAETLVISGELILEDDGRITAESVTIASGTLRGGGTITTKKLLNEGLLAPGEPLGQFEIQGDYQQEPGGQLEITVGGTPDAPVWDSLTVTGAALLSGELSVTLADGYRPTRNGTWLPILGADQGISGTFVVTESHVGIAHSSKQNMITIWHRSIYSRPQ